MLDVYAAFAEEFLAVPVIKGKKTDAEKFPGADTTYCIEALMQDGKALQAGTSHNLGQNFSRAFDIKFLGRDQKQEHVWTTSWGVSTRLIGALIMAHSDDEGLVLPPKVAPTVVAIVPIFRGDEERATIKAFTDKLVAELCGGQVRPPRVSGEGIESYTWDRETHQQIVVDWRDNRPGDKQYHWEQRGVPFRVEVGPRDVAGGAFVLKKRLDRSKETVQVGDASRAWLVDRLDQMQRDMLARARAFRDTSTRKAESYDELKRIVTTEGGFVRCFFKPDRAVEAKIKDETKATVRCIPLDQSGLSGRCIYTGEPTDTEVLFAIAY
jgi:prolyl-tRNA synthetase